MPTSFTHVIDRPNINVPTLRYDQNKTVTDNITNSTRTTPNEYLSDVINENSKIFTSLIGNKNTIIRGLECYIVNVDVKTVEILITPGVLLSKLQTITIESGYIVTLTLPFILGLSTYDTIGVFVVRSELPNQSPTFNIELHGIKSDNSFVSSSDSSSFNPITAPPESYNLLQLYKFELDAGDNFSKIKHKNIFQETTTGLNLDALITQYELTAGTTIPSGFGTTSVEYDIILNHSDYELFTTTNTTLQYHRFKLFPDNIVDEACYLIEHCDQNVFEQQLTKWIIPDLVQYSNYARSRIHRITNIYE